MPGAGRNAGLRLPGSGYGDGCGCIPQRDYFADLGAQYMQCGVCGQCRFGRQGFVPTVSGEGELGVVDGHDLFGTQFFGRQGKLVGHRVDVFPCFVVLSVFEDRQVNAGELPADLREMLAVTAVPAHVDLPCRGFPAGTRPTTSGWD